jgi:acetyl-CoA acetyltransferase
MLTKKNACIVGGGYSKIGVRQATFLDLIQEAARAAADDIPA